MLAVSADARDMPMSHVYLHQHSNATIPNSRKNDDPCAGEQSAKGRCPQSNRMFQWESRPRAGSGAVSPLLRPRSSQQTSSVLGTLVGFGCIIACTARTCRCLTRKLVLLLQGWSGLSFSALVKAAELASIRGTAALVFGLCVARP